MTSCCKIQIDSRPGDEVLGKIAARSSEVIFVDLVELKGENLRS